MIHLSYNFGHNHTVLGNAEGNEPRAWWLKRSDSESEPPYSLLTDSSHSLHCPNLYPPNLSIYALRIHPRNYLNLDYWVRFFWVTLWDWRPAGHDWVPRLVDKVHLNPSLIVHIISLVGQDLLDLIGRVAHSFKGLRSSVVSLLLELGNINLQLF